MANLSSTLITNRDAARGVFSSLSTGPMRQTYQELTVSAAELNGHVLRFVEVPSIARIASVVLWSGALGGSSAGDIGVYRKAKDGGAVVDADFFGSAVSMVLAVNGVEQSHESGVFTLTKRAQPLWQALGLSADPGATLDVAITLTANVNTGGLVALEVWYAV